MADYIIAIDQGTTSSRAIIFDKKGSIVATGQKEHEQILPKAGWVEHDPAEIWRNVQEVIGLALSRADLTRHDIRFVEDNWASPALGAWGLGWEVWLDGLEITQFTYFQQAGSLELEPVSVEITYGLDRILMALQDVTHFKDLAWNPSITGRVSTMPAARYSVKPIQYALMLPALPTGMAR